MPGGPPAALLRQIEAHYGSVRVVAPVGGGCINPAVRLRLAGRDAFLKYHATPTPGVFGAEAAGLQALRRAAAALRVPAVLGVWDAPPGTSAPGGLLLEWIEPAARAGDEFGERLGRGLAALHRAAGGGAGGWGWEAEGFLGPLPQPNRPAARWADFWRERRLEPQLRRAFDAGRRIGATREWERLWAALPALLAPAEADGASLLHGDLWSGNVLAAAGPTGAEPALVDPAVYRGHREVDLAMAELFGGFPESFLAAYCDAWPLQPGYAPGRRAAYQLYYLLVHVNLFGAGYLAATERALREALRAA